MGFRFMKTDSESDSSLFSLEMFKNPDVVQNLMDNYAIALLVTTLRDIYTRTHGKESLR